nr:hypothetical protein [uncultured Celeribacter sp.]
MQVISEALPEVVTVEDFKRATHFSGGEAGDDLQLAVLLQAARETVETASGRPLGIRDVLFTAMIEPGARRWYFPVAPVVQLQAVEVMSEGVTSTLDLDQMQLEAGHDEPRMVFAHGVLPVQSGALLRVQASVGAAGGSLRMALLQAIFLIAKEWFEAGIAVDDPPAAPRLSFGARTLLRQNRYKRPKVWGM